MVCLDTDVIVHFLRNNQEAVDLIRKVIETKEKIKTTSINEFELWKGVYNFYNEKREKTLNQFLSGVYNLNLDSKSSQKAAEIFESLKSQGETVDALDVMIASIAITNNEPLLTLNTKHFERIPELKLIE